MARHDGCLGGCGRRVGLCRAHAGLRQGMERACWGEWARRGLCVVREGRARHVICENQQVCCGACGRSAGAMDVSGACNRRASRLQAGAAVCKGSSDRVVHTQVTCRAVHCVRVAVHWRVVDCLPGLAGLGKGSAVVSSARVDVRQDASALAGTRGCAAARAAGVMCFGIEGSTSSPPRNGTNSSKTSPQRETAKRYMRIFTTSEP